jgi:SPX domain protein involved in polyphosphate accumulation
VRIKYFNRYELKYVLRRSQADQIAGELAKHLDPDPYSDNGGQYAITSLYYDTEDYRAYWDKIDGHRFRRKVRIRVYGTQPVTPEADCFVEIKQRINKSLQKKRVIVPYSTALALCGSGKGVQMDSEVDQEVVREVQYLSEALQLRPACVVSYNRLALNGHEYDVGLRVTFDTNLKCRIHDLSLLTQDQGENHYFLPPDWCIMEIKVNHRLPFWLTEFIGKHRCTLQRVSKYCTALEKSKLMLRESRIRTPTLH